MEKVHLYYQKDVMSIDRIQTTQDGSHTLYSSVSGETYHSTFGAIQESKHIFIEAGLVRVLLRKPVSVNVLEIGTGTGLNVLLTLIETNNCDLRVTYDGYEPFPISMDEADALNYTIELKADPDEFKLIHSDHGQAMNIRDNFLFRNIKNKVEQAELPGEYYDIVYFDAFSPDAQPELWTTNIFFKIFNSLRSDGILTTYSCKGVVKRSMKEAGFEIEKLPGPPGKREFLRATKP